MIQFLGGKCCKCGYDTDIRALQLDHINGDGYKYRKLYGKEVRYHAKNLDACKEILQVLCANCHAIKSIENRDHDRKNVQTLKKMH